MYTLCTTKSPNISKDAIPYFERQAFKTNVTNVLVQLGGDA